MQNKKLTVRLSQEDHTRLIMQSREFGKSKNEYIRQLIRRDMLSDIIFLNDFLYDTQHCVRKISINLNQIAKKINSGVPFEKIQEVNYVIEEVNKLCLLLKQ